MQTTFDAVVFHQTHHRAPARLGGHHLLAHFAVIALQLAQFTGQVVHFRFAEGQRFLQLIASGAVIAQLHVQFIATRASTLFRAGVGAHANVLQFFIQIVEQLFLGVIRALQRGQHLIVLTKLRRMSTHRVARAAFDSACSRRWRSFVEIAVAAEHFRRIGVAEVGPALHNFRRAKAC